MVSTEAQELIANVRDHIEREEYPQAVALLRDAPAARPGWAPHEHDEVACLAEFLSALDDPQTSMVRL